MSIFLNKKTIFTVVINTEKGNKVAGIVNLDLAEYIAKEIPGLLQEILQNYFIIHLIFFFT